MLSFTTIANPLLSQEKYAVLITGDYAANGIPVEDQWGQGAENPMEEFWYDTYLMWEMLVTKKGFSNEYVYVLFADGEDFTKENMWERYTASYHGLDQITDFPATKSNIEAVFNGLATGSNEFPLMTTNDFLFVWTFDHGG